eukprot:gene7071-7866_t
MKFPSITICGFRGDEYRNFNIDYALPVNKDLKTMITNVSMACWLGATYSCSYERDFKETLLVDQGFCTTFNPSGTLSQMRAGSFYGLHLVLFANASKSKQGPLFNDNVLEVFIHDHDEFPFYNSQLIALGSLTKISLTRKVIERKPHPYSSNCITGKGISLMFPGRYTLHNCQESCVAYHVAKNCSYADINRNYYLPKHLKRLVGKNESQLECFINTFDRLDAEGFQSCGCSLPCQEIKFVSSISHTYWPPEDLKPTFKEAISDAFHVNESILTDGYIRKNFAKINIFYSDMSYEIIRETASYTLDKLISDIGGQMDQSENARIWIEKCDAEMKQVAPVETKYSKPIRHDWYQTEQNVVITIMAKNCNKDDVEIEFGKQHLSVSLKLPNERNYNLEIDLAHAIVPEDCTTKVLSTKIEIKMKKMEGIRWTTLECRDEPKLSTLPTQDGAATQDSSVRSYPTSAMKYHDWNKLAADVEKDENEEKKEGDAALNQLFQKIYADASDETKRAMNKSFVESGGTVLSTNWKDIGNRTVECKPPDGMEFKKYEL